MPGGSTSVSASRAQSTASWLVGLGVDPDAGRGATHSKALVIIGHDVIVKVHRTGTDPHTLGTRVQLAAAAPELIHPREPEPVPVPTELSIAWGVGEWATVWPRVETLHPDTDPGLLPWEQAGSLLSHLHARTPRLDGEAPTPWPVSGGPRRCRRALARLRFLDDPRAGIVRAAARTLPPPEAVLGGARLVHGDWHPGQLGREIGEPDWRLIDVDDLGRGAAVGDLARPAAFRAVGLLPEAAWEALVAGYRSGPGDALPATGPVWDAVDLAARWAVVVAAAGLLRDGTDALGGAGHETLTAFIEACHSMQSE